ncbi:Amidophosphoribosyltransferase [Mollivirus kamchatka]|nr:Amidophosphoribosyltransferase [Mollivirus kamchatka]
MCGIVGVIKAGGGSARCDLIGALSDLQHRGQDAAGAAACDAEGRMSVHKGAGTVDRVFGAAWPVALPIDMPIAIGHVRYPTSGSKSEAQPFECLSERFGRVAIVHNGTLGDLADLARATRQTDVARCDSQIMLHALVHNLEQALVSSAAAHHGTQDQAANDEALVFAAVERLFGQCSGGYACAVLIETIGLVLFRDPQGIRPLCYGAKTSGDGQRLDWMAASESVALDNWGAEEDSIKDVRPGEVIVMRFKPTMEVAVNGNLAYNDDLVVLPRPCLFEYVYFAHPNSVLDGIPVYGARLEMGRLLAARIRHVLSAEQLAEVQCVIAVPETARIAAGQVAYELGLPLREGLLRNRYQTSTLARTFIMADAESRGRAVARKFTAVGRECRDKAVVVVDDSVVRGTTSKFIIDLLRKSGATKVYLASCSPPIRYPNVYGIDIPSAKELIASGRTEHEVALLLGADQVIYQSVDDLQAACRQFNPSITAFEASVFVGPETRQ